MDKPTSTPSRKKVVLRQLDGVVVKGYVDPGGFLGPEGVEVLDREGHLIVISLKAIKGIFFVRDFDGDSSRQERKVFSSRPRMSGVWIRMRFKDEEVLEGLMANDLLAVEPSGFMVTPPDFYSNNLRVFAPRTALVSVEVLGVISDESARRAAQRGRRAGAKPSEESEQIGLFPPPPNP